MFELIDTIPSNAVIKVIGVGGGGGNAVKHMIENDVEGVDFICANTDAQALSDVISKTILQLGGDITKGLGAGANPEIGRAAAMEDRDRICDALQGADMVFITAGMGGGTGTGGAPVVAEVARELGILTVAVVTRPFAFEGKKRLAIALDGLAELEQHVDSLITIPNEKLLEVLGRNTSLLDAFREANDVLLGAVQGIADLIIRPGMINVDFADVRTVMSEMGMAMMGTGYSKGENRAQKAAESAIASPLLDDINLAGARGILVNITAGHDLSLGEFSEVGETVEEYASEDATVVVGTVIDTTMKEEIKVTVVATGLAGEAARATLQIVEGATPRMAQSEPEKEPEQEPEQGQEPMAAPDYREYDRPAAMRNTNRRMAAGQTAQEADSASEEYFDIPAFLRRQADLGTRLAPAADCGGCGAPNPPPGRGFSRPGPP